MDRRIEKLMAQPLSAKGYAARAKDDGFRSRAGRPGRDYLKPTPIEAYINAQKEKSNAR